MTLKKDYTIISSKSEDKVKLIQELHKNYKKNYYEIRQFTTNKFNYNYYTILFYKSICYLFTNPFFYYLYIFLLLNYELIKTNSKEATNSVKEITLEINKIKEEIKK